ncbi:MAG: bifunctional oligoribonuclease/PAP phosphatase NrnA [Bdellovibrionales bacterium]|nr:bifunctional oligoribonuclease/PAP phosphatase NrnA [Bdellovibrionales bacterium]
MINSTKFKVEIQQWIEALQAATRVLLTSPGAADGDSIGAQLALRQMILQSFPKISVLIINDEPLPLRYQFLPGAQFVHTPESFLSAKESSVFDVAIIVDGGIDRAGRVRYFFEKAKTTVFIDHHAVSVEFPYTIRIVEPMASSTTELMYHLSQTESFKTKVDSEFAQLIYLGLVFDTGFFRHSNTTPEVMELSAILLRTGFDFTRVGERGMLERSFSSLKMMSEILNHSELNANGKIIWSSLSQKTLQKYKAVDDDREGIIDHMFLIHGIEVAVLFFELVSGKTKVSFRSRGSIDVANFARTLTEHGGGHKKAAGALLDKEITEVAPWVLSQLEKTMGIK